MIPANLLALTEGRAIGSVIYGGAGLKKTLSTHTLPPPILHFDFEGGTAPLSPWIRRRRRWDTQVWTNVSQEERTTAFKMLPADWDSPLAPKKPGCITLASPIMPAPYIDVISFDNLVPASHEEFIRLVGSFNPAEYCSASLDSLAELSVGVQSYSKKQKGINPLDSMENAMLWGPIQERTGIALRQMRNWRQYGIFIYFMGQEQIDKEYVTDPREKKKGEGAPEAYSVKGTAAVPGKMAEAVQHCTDLMFHVRLMSGNPVWVTAPEPIALGSGAYWETKDRWGRITEKYVFPNFRTIFGMIYGKEASNGIYEHAKSLAQG